MYHMLDSLNVRVFDEIVAKKLADQKAAAEAKAKAAVVKKSGEEDDDGSGSDDDGDSKQPSSTESHVQDVTTLPQDLDVLLTKFPVDREQALRAVSRYCLARRLYLPFIAISLHAGRPHYVTRVRT
jgi:hypothetical protein